MKVTVEQIGRQCEEELIVRCHDPQREPYGLGKLKPASENRPEARRACFFVLCGLFCFKNHNEGLLSGRLHV